MGRILSPNDVYYHYAPWAFSRSVEAQNPTLDAAATGILPVASLVRGEPSALHWNRYLASGIPGFGSSVILSPFILLPALLLPLSLLYYGIVLLKLNFAFLFTWLWLREERLGKRGAAFGAITFAASGIFSVWWLMHPTNATALYPALLYVVARAFQRKRLPLAPLVVLAIMSILAGFPAMIAYAVYTVAGYAVYRAIRERSIPWRALRSVAAALAIGLMISAPFFFTFFDFLRRTGYLEARSSISAMHVYPLAHLESFVRPYRLGDPAARLWIGDPALGWSNDFVEASVYLGIVSLPLIFAGALSRKGRHRWFWLAFFVVILLLIFGLPGMSRMAGALPGLKFSPLTRLRVLLPIPAAYLAAAGVSALLASRSVRRWRAVTALAAVALVLGAAFDLGIFAARFYPYLKPRVARIPVTPALELLKREPGPFRIAPFFSWLYPNTAELFRLEDIRSHFSSEAAYRAMMARIDAGSWDSPTVLMFNGLKTNIAHPFLGLLNVRYLIEQPNIDIVRWTLLANTTAVMPEAAAIRIGPGQAVRRTVHIDSPKFEAIELTIRPVQEPGAGDLEIALIRPETGQIVHERLWSRKELERMDKVYAPVRGLARQDQALLLTIRTRGMSVDVLGGAAPPGESPLFYRRVEIPVILAHELADGRIFQNLAELPRHYANWDLREVTSEEFLEAKDVDFGSTALLLRSSPSLARGLAAVPREERRVVFRLLEYLPDRQTIETDSQVPFLLATSEKLTRELRVTVDGRPADPIEINSLFAGVPMEAGRHRVVLTRRIGRDVWWLAIAGVLLFAALWLFERRWNGVSEGVPRE